MYPDFEELLAELNSAGAEYLIGGAHAVAFHARPRATKSNSSGRRVTAAL